MVVLEIIYLQLLMTYKIGRAMKRVLAVLVASEDISGRLMHDMVRRQRYPRCKWAHLQRKKVDSQNYRMLSDAHIRLLLYCRFMVHCDESTSNTVRGQRETIPLWWTYSPAMRDGAWTCVVYIYQSCDRSTIRTRYRSASIDPLMTVYGPRHHRVLWRSRSWSS